MKRTAIFAALLFAFAGTALAELHGSWTASTNESKTGRLHMNINRGASHNFGNSFDVADFTALTDAQVRSSMTTPVRFQLVREGGTVVFEGTFRNGDGAGQWTFNGDRGYIAAVRALGVPFDLENEREGEEADLFTVALLDVSTSYIKSMQAIGYRESLEQYLSMRIFHVTPELVRELRDLRYDNISAEDLIAMRIHRVTPEYIRELKAAGYTKIPVEKLIEMKIHRIDAKFIEKMN